MFGIIATMRPRISVAPVLVLVLWDETPYSHNAKSVTVATREP